MTLFYAQPFNSNEDGFFFTSAADFQCKSLNNRSQSGDVIQNYAIQYVGERDIDWDLAQAWKLTQSNFEDFLTATKDWDRDRKIHYVIAVRDCGYSHDQVVSGQEKIEIEVFALPTLKALAQHFVDEGLLGEVPQLLCRYIDIDKLARHLGRTYAEVTIDGHQFVYLLL